MKTRFDRREFSLGALAASTALATASRPARAQTAPVKIRVGWVVVPASLAPLILEKKDILKHYGQSYVAEAIRFEGTPPVITALASGEVDIGPLAFSSFGLAIQNAHMDDLRVISDEIQDGVAGHGSNEFMVLKDGPVKTVADLKGKVLATNAMGSAVDLVDFLEDVVRAVRWFTDPNNHEEAVAIVARLNKAPPARMAWAFGERDQYRDPNGTPNIAALQNNLQLQKQVGFLKDDIDVKKYSDLSMVTEAAKRLG